MRVLLSRHLVVGYLAQHVVFRLFLFFKTKRLDSVVILAGISRQSICILYLSSAVEIHSLHVNIHNHNQLACKYFHLYGN
jgi:hypothetical protein